MLEGLLTLPTYVFTMTSQEHYGISVQQPLDSLIKGVLRLISKEASKLYIKGPLWGDTTRDWWIHLTKNQ